MSYIMERVKCLIIGSGPAGYTAAIYAARAGLKPVEYDGMQMGGQLTQTTEVENFPGYPQGVDANQMMMEIREQAERFGTEMRGGEIIEVDFSARAAGDLSAPLRCKTDAGEWVESDTVIIATGASAKYLGLEDERRLMGAGVSACATCDGFFYRKKRVAVVGGGDTACEDALYLANLAEKVFLIVRKPFLRASKVMHDRVLNNEKIEVLFEHNTLSLIGEDGVEGARLVRRKGEADEAEVEIKIDGFFLAIGHNPNTDIFKEYIETDAQGYFVTHNGSPLTKVPGVFVAGDCADPIYRQAITAAASGCKAGIEAERYLK